MVALGGLDERSCRIGDLSSASKILRYEGVPHIRSGPTLAVDLEYPALIGEPSAQPHLSR